MSDIELTEITGLREFWALSVIRVKPRQRRFTSNVLMNWMQSRHPAVSFYRVDKGKRLAGYVMLIHAQEPTQWIIERLTIDAEYQRQGLGYAVADQLIDMVHGFENSEMVIARYAPENVAARKLFDKLGFKVQDELFRDRHVAVLKFEFEEVEDEDDSDEPQAELDAGDDDFDDDDDDADDDEARD